MEAAEDLINAIDKIKEFIHSTKLSSKLDLKVTELLV